MKRFLGLLTVIITGAIAWYLIYIYKFNAVWAAVIALGIWWLILEKVLNKITTRKVRVKPVKPQPIYLNIIEGGLLDSVSIKINQINSVCKAINEPGIRKKVKSVCNTLQKITKSLSKAPQNIDAFQTMLEYYPQRILELVLQYKNVEELGTSGHRQKAEEIMDLLENLERGLRKDYDNLLREIEDQLSLGIRKVKKVTESDYGESEKGGI